MNVRATLLAMSVPALVLGALYGWTVAPTIAPLHDTVDSAELVSVAAVLGVAHPPGEALWLPAARLALAVVPVDEPALRTNLLSAVLMAAAGAAVAAAACRWRPETPWWGAAAAALFFGLSPVAWSQAVVTEVYALQALLAGLALVLGAEAARGRWRRPFFLVLGLLVASHLTALALAVPLAAAALRARPWARRDAAWCAALLVLPLVYSAVYLWLRADAAIAWGQTDSLRGLADHLLGGQYRDVVERSPSAVAAALPQTVRAALRELPPPAWLLLVPGLFSLARTRATLALVLGAWLAALAVFVSAYAAEGREDYLQGTTMALALVAGWGVVAVWDRVASHISRRGARAGAGLLAVAFFAWWAVQVGHDVSLRGDTTLVDEARATLAGLPEGARVETSRDRETFPLWYVTTVLRERADVTVVDVRGLAPAVGPRP